MSPLKVMNQPMTKGNFQVKNRFVMPPMVTHYASADGFVIDQQIAYYAKRAQGGVGLIVVEAAAVSPEGRGSPYWLGLYNDVFIPALKRLTKAIRKYDTKIFIQLAHAGRQTSSAHSGLEPVAPSSITCSPFGEIPRELSIDEIKDIEIKFGEAARRAYEANFDGIEIHGAHGYLVHQFLSPRTNHRSDEYGAGPSQRARFLMQILQCIKQRVPPNFIIGCRLNGKDYVKGGLEIKDTKDVGLQLSEKGISYLHISCGVAESAHMTIPPMDVKPGFLAPLAEAVKNIVSVPVIAVGRISNVHLADSLVSNGRADLVAMGRALWADPELPNKALEGRFDEIRPCIACNQGCRRRVDRCCLMNPETGREIELTFHVSKKSKKILVIGGGPAGMEFARVAAMRGHEVTLLEKSSRLGGNFRLAGMSPERSEILKGVDYLEREIRRLGVHVETKSEASPDEQDISAFDEIVVATGASPVIPSIQGIEAHHVVLAQDIFLKKRNVGNCVLIIGGGMVGCEVADLLSAKGKMVILTEMLPDVIPHADPPSAFFIRQRLQNQNVEVRSSCKVTRIAKSMVHIEQNERKNILGPIDTIVIAAGYRASAHCPKSLKSVLGKKACFIGDAFEARDALWAIYEGSKAAREI